MARNKAIPIKSIEPLELREDSETGDHFVIYSNPDGFEFELRFDGEEPWATQKQMSELFGRDISVISRHIQTIFSDEELDTESNLQKMQIANSDKPVIIYSLDVILAVGYKVGSKQGMMFRRWANQILKQYLLKGFVIDEKRLENPDNRGDYFNELMDTIRSIRSSEKRMWTRVIELASFCSDYDMLKKSDITNFYATLQNTMHYAVHGHTAADIVCERLDASKPNCGVIHYSGKKPKVTEASTAKNVLGETEINALNILTSAVLEFFESQVEQKRATTLEQFLQKLRDFVKLDGRPLIPEGFLGNHSQNDAKKKASTEIGTYNELLRIQSEDKGEKAVVELLTQARKLASKKTANRRKAAKKRKKQS